MFLKKLDKENDHKKDQRGLVDKIEGEEKPHDEHLGKKKEGKPSGGTLLVATKMRPGRPFATQRNKETPHQERERSGDKECIPERPTLYPLVKIHIKITQEQKREHKNQKLICGSPIDHEQVFDKENGIEDRAESQREKRVWGLCIGKEKEDKKGGNKLPGPEKREKIKIECNKKEQPEREPKPCKRKNGSLKN